MSNINQSTAPPKRLSLVANGCTLVRMWDARKTPEPTKAGYILTNIHRSLMVYMALPTSSKELVVGLMVGHLQLLRRVRSNPKDCPMKRKKWRVRCTVKGCGNEFTIPQSYLVRKPSPKTHCGCLNKSDKTIYNREYRIWIMMQVRCNDPRHVAYKNYGGRGIRVAPEWMDPVSGFTAFITHIGPAPSTSHTLDRKEVNGNYEPGNVRWATPKEQAANKRKKS